jgi:septum formation protein
VLASGSAARRTLLQAAGLAFRVLPADVDEAAIKALGGTAEQAALALADAKAASIQDNEAVVIGADQILVCGTIWFDKPPDLATARDHLRQLRGREHRLVTAVVCWRGGRRLWEHVAQPVLRMRAFSDAFLDRYMAAEAEALLGSVGAYRLEGLGMQLFDAVEGEHSAVLGLPMLPLLGYLRREGVLRD